MRISDWSSDVCSSDLDADDALSAQGEAVANVAAARAALEAAQIDLGFTRIVAPIGGRIGRSAFTPGALVTTGQIGRASCRERVCQYVEISVVAVSLTKKKKK